MTSSAEQHTVPLAGDRGSIPIVGFGTWQLRGQDAYDAVRFALDAGYRHLDTATMYENEAQVGQAVRDSGIPREEIFVTTKLPPDNAGRERKTLDASLAALGLDYVDLWLIHWPPDPEGGSDTWRQFLALRDESGGKLRAVGVSNYSTGQIDRLIEVAGEAPAVNQIKWSPTRYDAQVLEHNRSRGVVLEGYSPFRAGRLDLPELERIAAEHGVTPAQVVLRWHVEHGVVVIPKSSRPERIQANFDVFGFSLSAEEMASIDALAGEPANSA